MTTRPLGLPDFAIDHSADFHGPSCLVGSPCLTCRARRRAVEQVDAVQLLDDVFDLVRDRLDGVPRARR